MPAMQRAIRLIESDEAPDSAFQTIATPGNQLLAAISGMIADGLDPEVELNKAIIAAYDRGAPLEGKGKS